MAAFMDQPFEMPGESRWGRNSVEQIAKVSGLDYFKGMLSGEYSGPEIGRTLNFYMVHADEGTVTFTTVPDERHLNPMGIIHGGLAATLLDSALACCVQTLCPVGYASTSVELKVNFVRPVMVDTGQLWCTGTVIHPGRQLATAEARLVNREGKLFAHGTQTCSVFKL